MVKNPDRTQPFAQWQEVDVTFPETADTDCVVQHSLTPSNPEHVNYAVVRKSQAIDVYHDTSGTRKPWTPGVILLRSPVANATVTLLLWVSHDPRPPIFTPQNEAPNTPATDITGVLIKAQQHAQTAYKDEGNVFTASGNEFDEILKVDKGLQFPATQVSSSDANVLDDYEEGTWTPVIGGSGGVSGQSYSTQLGTYVKVGRKVTVNFYAALSNKGTITGDVKIQGFPFTNEGTYFAAGTIGFWANLTTAFASIQLHMNPGEIDAYLRPLAAAGATVGLMAAADLSNTSALLGSITYRTSS